MIALRKPRGMFDRTLEWNALSRFAIDPEPQATLGVVSGRRRQGKTYLLRALCRAADGFYFAADQATDAESLRQLGAALAEYLDSPALLSFPGWHEAVDALLALGRDRPIPVVIDEFPYLVKANSSIPSIIQNALAPLRAERENSRTRLLLCGSAMSFMGSLLSGNAPLRGRASLELVVPTLDYRLAAEFWDVKDPATALKVNAIVGGTPAYRREFARDDSPATPQDFNSWVVRTVLAPTSPLFREARYLLADEPELHDTGLYHSVLAAIATGNTNRGSIASYLGRKSGDLAHALNVLEDSGLIAREIDVFKENRSNFRIAEPLVTFYHAVMRPVWADLEATRNATSLWKRSQSRFISNIVGPRFEYVCRQWTHHYSDPELFGDYPIRVGSGTVNDPTQKISHQLDVVAFGFDDNSHAPLLAIGEAKWGETMSMKHLERLRRIRTLLIDQGKNGADTMKLVCYGAAGFTRDLIAHAKSNDDTVLIGLDDLYGLTGRDRVLEELAS